jgi:hypothetical protein
LEVISNIICEKLSILTVLKQNKLTRINIKTLKYIEHLNITSKSLKLPKINEKDFMNLKSAFVSVQNIKFIFPI